MDADNKPPTGDTAAMIPTSSPLSEVAIPTGSSPAPVSALASASPDPSIPPSHLDEERDALAALTSNVRDQDDLERDITAQATRALNEAEDKRDTRRIEKAIANRDRLAVQLASQEHKRRLAIGSLQAMKRLDDDILRLKLEINVSEQDVVDLKARMELRHKETQVEAEAGPSNSGGGGGGGGKLPGETQREYLIRTGKITPFSKLGGPRLDEGEGDLAAAVAEAEDEALARKLQKEEEGPRSHRNLRLPGFAEESVSAPEAAVEAEFSLRPRKKRRAVKDEDSEQEFVPEETAEVTGAASDGEDDEDEFDMTDMVPKKRKKKGKGKASDALVDVSGIDDGNEAVYQDRLKDWVDRRSRARRIHQENLGQPVDSGSQKEWFMPSPDHPDHVFENGLKLPGDIYPSLFDYQKTGVQWLAELFAQQVGGIVGDEMGLGKTGMCT
jgi:DNA excision repair protein ERCC-6